MSGRTWTGRNWIVLVVAVAVWVAYFYAMDRYILQIQGLPVGVDLMPV
jgi:hypothetical protein